MTFYANTKGKQNFFLTLISATGTAPGLVLGDTITINGITYTASASEVPASGNFLLVTSGTASSNIADTTRSLVKVINIRDANLSAYYISGFNELPGKIWTQANDYSTSVCLS